MTQGDHACLDLLLVRHGETAWNVRRRFVGQADPPMNGRGWRQTVRKSIQLRGLLNNGGKPVIVSSDLLRAKQTASLIGEVTHTSSLWRELDFGAWTGKTYEEIIQSDDGPRFRAWYDNPWKISPPGGETLETLMERVRQGIGEALCFVQHQSDIPILVIVTHGGPIRAVEALLKGRPRDLDTYWSCSIGTGDYVRHRLELTELAHAISALRTSHKG